MGTTPKAERYTSSEMPGMGGHEAWQKPLNEQQKALRLIIEGIQDGLTAEADSKASEVEAGIKKGISESPACIAMVLLFAWAIWFGIQMSC